MGWKELRAQLSELFGHQASDEDVLAFKKAGGGMPIDKPKFLDESGNEEANIVGTLPQGKLNLPDSQTPRRGS